jgi:hypothetical protein
MRVFPQPGRAVEEDALRGRQLVLGEEVLVEERQLDGVGDLLDLVVETADVVVGDVGHLLEDQLLHLGPGELLEQEARPGVHEDGVARPQRLGEPLGQLHHPLLVGTTDDQRPAVAQLLLQRHDLAGELGPAGQHDVQRLVEHHLGALLEVVGVELGVQGHADLAPTGEDVDGPVVVRREVGAVGGRRLGELVDLLAQRRDVLAGFAQGVGEPLVLGDGLGQLPLGLEQALLEGAYTLRRVLQPPPQREELVFQDRCMVTQLRQLGLDLGLVDGDHLPHLRPSRTLHGGAGGPASPGRSANVSPVVAVLIPSPARVGSATGPPPRAGPTTDEGRSQR